MERERGCPKHQVGANRGSEVWCGRGRERRRERGKTGREGKEKGGEKGKGKRAGSCAGLTWQTERREQGTPLYPFPPGHHSGSWSIGRGLRQPA